MCEGGKYWFYILIKDFEKVMWIKKVFNFFGIEVIWEMELFELLLFLFDGVCVVWEIL